MKKSARIAQLTGSVLASLASATFVCVYNTIEMHHARLNNIVDSLPNLTSFYARTSPYGFIMPFLVFVVGILCIKFEKTIVADIAIYSAGWVFSLVWALGCILAWKLPYHIPVIELR